MTITVAWEFSLKKIFICSDYFCVVIAFVNSACVQVATAFDEKKSIKFMLLYGTNKI